MGDPAHGAAIGGERRARLRVPAAAPISTACRGSFGHPGRTAGEGAR
jgi:hypothetical protein